jgi:hypothetical protein
MHVFGVRHLSPSASHHLLAFLEDIKPLAVLVEGPSDVSHLIESITSPFSEPPLAVMVYTDSPPVRTLLLPYAAYSPEYAALRWAVQRGVHCRFIDLPARVLLAIHERNDFKDPSNRDEPTAGLYANIAARNGFGNYDDYWESVFEHNMNPVSYRQSVIEFGRGLRSLASVSSENQMREAHMRLEIENVRKSGVPDDKIVVICGAYHAPALDEPTHMTAAEARSLPTVSVRMAMMPYSNLRLSSRAGYGAGNRSPQYFAMLRQLMQDNLLSEMPSLFFTQLARYMRDKGALRSPSDVIEATRLSFALASLRKSSLPVLSELRSAAATCFGGGELSAVSTALNALEVGTAMGSVEPGTDGTALQYDFDRELRLLNLENCKTTVAADIVLDLRKDRDVTGTACRRPDLQRSFFLHRLTVLGISFAVQKPIHQQKADWKECFTLRWTVESEMELIESSLAGETVEAAAANVLRGMITSSDNISALTRILKLSELCNLPEVTEHVLEAIQPLLVSADELTDLANGCDALAGTVRYGCLRKTDTSNYIPLISRLFYRAVLSVPRAARCDNEAAVHVRRALSILHETCRGFTQDVDRELWARLLFDTARRDDVNPHISGYAAALLLENKKLDDSTFEQWLSFRLSPGMPADKGCAWFDGLIEFNRYALLSMPSVWRSLDSYISGLDDEQFKRALVFLRRAFSAFSPSEKRLICGRLNAIWQNCGDIPEYSEAESRLLQGLDDLVY